MNKPTITYMNVHFPKTMKPVNATANNCTNTPVTQSAPLKMNKMVQSINKFNASDILTAPSNASEILKLNMMQIMCEIADRYSKT